MTYPIYDQYIDDAAKKLAEDIDDELLLSILGWQGMNVNTGTILGEKYNTVSPIWSSKMLFGSNNTWDDMVAWCVENFGPTSVDSIWTPSQRWYCNNAKFWFKHEGDLTLFLLRWS